ncbi:uncharacterized protein [Apostichopus japonicus]|uniref:uncharacterized protein isoform X2 n=1 Tax=Stichopus japonicus TaxID=307972 RepID=UPI003AB8A1D5
MRLWTTQTLLQWSLIIATLLSQTMRQTGATQAKRGTSHCKTTGIGIDVISSSCEDRCFLGYDESSTCQCNYQCIECDNCCHDIQRCNNETSCATRCDADFNRRYKCHCDDDCEKNRNCCFDYTEHCNPSTSTTAIPSLTPKSNGDPSTSTAIPNLTPKSNGESPTTTTAVTTLTPKAYGGTSSGLIVVFILVICLVITSAIAAAVFILVRKRRTNPPTTEIGSNDIAVGLLMSYPVRGGGTGQCLLRFAKGGTRSCETTGIGMGGRRDSCVGRCFLGYDRGRPCQCHYQCIKCRNCCEDYEDCKPPTSSTEVPTLTTEANGQPPTSTTTVPNLTPKAYGGTGSGPILVVILVICLVITSPIAAAVFILVRKRRTNPTTTENGSNANGSGPTNEEQGSVYYSSVKESEYVNQEEGVDSNFAYQIYEKQIFQDIVTT